MKVAKERVSAGEPDHMTAVFAESLALGVQRRAGALALWAEQANRTGEDGDRQET